MQSTQLRRPPVVVTVLMAGDHEMKRIRSGMRRNPKRPAVTVAEQRGFVHQTAEDQQSRPNRPAFDGLYLTREIGTSVVNLYQQASG